MPTKIEIKAKPVSNDEVENEMGEEMEAPHPMNEEATEEQCVPVEFLAQPDQQDTMTEPAEGDEISMQVEATINRIENGKAYFTPKAINGHVLREEGETPTPDDTEEGLRGEAEKMSQDQEAGM